MLQFLFISLWIIPIVNGACNSAYGPSGYTECVRIEPQYTDYQWATCLTDKFIKMVSQGRHSCLNGSTYCYYQCMIELNNLESGDVYENCSCSGTNDNISPRTNASLPSWCFSPTGTECNWYNDCLQKKYKCLTGDDMSIQYSRAICELHKHHVQLFSETTQKWIESLRNCLQAEMVPLIRSYSHYDCIAVSPLLKATLNRCFNYINVCDVHGYDFFRVFVTLTEKTKNSSLNTFSDTNNLLQIRLKCINSDPVHRFGDIAVLHIHTKFKAEHMHTFYNKSMTQNSVQNIGKSLSQILGWEQNGISWYAWQIKDFEYSISYQNGSIFILLASMEGYDINYRSKHLDININKTIYNFISTIKEGLHLSVDNLSVNITSLEACNDFKCHNVYLDTDKTANNEGYCSAEIYDGISWWKTIYGGTDIKPCCNGSTGNVSRNCMLNGKWDIPVHINCIDKKLVEASNKLDGLQDLTNNQQASALIEGILNTLEKITENTVGEPIKSGDLKKTAELLSSLIRTCIKKNCTVDAKKVVDIINSLLDSQNSYSWTEVNEQGGDDDGAARIMRIVEDLGKLIQMAMQSSDKPLTIKESNIELQISALEHQLTFPTRSKSKFLLENQTGLSGKFYTAAVYKTLSEILPTTNKSSVGSDVISISFGESTIYLEKNITITFERNKRENFIRPEISCSYWNFTTGGWSNNGCQRIENNRHFTTCSCNHLTNFAILMSPSDIEISDADLKVLEIITYIGCGLSILGCLLTLIIYFMLWRYVKNEWAVILVNLCISLIIGYAVFLGAVEETANDIACNIITAILHYIFLVVFCLMLAEGVSVATSVTIVFKKKSKLPLYLTLAWVFPLLIVGATMGITKLEGYHSNKYCWLNVSQFVYMAFVGPALLIILFNIVTICLVLRALYSSGAMVNEKIKKKARAGVKCMVTLLPVLGLSWLFGVLAFNEDTIVFQYLFGITTSGQGVFIFIFHVVLNKKVHEGFRKTLYKRRSKALSKTVNSRPKSSGTRDKIESGVHSTDSTNFDVIKTDKSKSDELKSKSPNRTKLRTGSPNLMKRFLKINRKKEYQVTKD